MDPQQRMLLEVIHTAGAIAFSLRQCPSSPPVRQHALDSRMFLDSQDRTVRSVARLPVPVRLASCATERWARVLALLRCTTHARRSVQEYPCIHGLRTIKKRMTRRLTGWWPYETSGRSPSIPLWEDDVAALW